MKKLIITAMTVSAILVGCKQANPLLSNFDTPFATPPFDKIELEHYVPAFDAAIAELRTEVDAIVNDKEAPTFDNTIVAYERIGGRLNDVSGIFFNLNSCATSDTMQQIALEVQPKLTEVMNDISLNEKLFERVKTVYDSRDNYQLDAEQKTLLERTYKGFTRSGAGLNDDDKKIYREITAELSNLSLIFSQNVLAATNAFVLELSETDIAGLPDFVKESMSEDAKERGKQGWVVTLQAPSYVPFMTYSPNGEVKQKLWRAFNSRSFNGEYDNSENVKRIAELSLKLANLLGYKTYADYVLEEHMAKNIENVNKLLSELLTASKPAAQHDFDAVKAYAAAQSEGVKDFKPWDFGYYEELYKNEKFSLNQELIKPYLKLENVQQGIFMLTEKLYGVTFKQNKEIAVYHPEVVVYEVYDGTGKFLAILYMDFFPRASKRNGAWMTSFREMYVDAKGEEVRPLVSVCCNFTKPTSTTPSLLTFDELTTFLHEFGHALHGIFAQGKYRSITGTNVRRDFVELPSQIMENWATEKDFLDLFAVHYKTGEKMPAELIQKIIDTKNYLAAYRNVRQLSFGITDMAWYSITAPVTEGVDEFEKAAMAPTQFFPSEQGISMSTSFGHIFGGGYAAGYYSYKWAEVLEADAFSLFKEKGVFDTETAESFRKNVLSKGGSEEPMTLYVRFRGHEPDVKPLLKKMGVLE